MQNLLESRKIGVIVDSASFHNLMRIIGIGQVNLQKLLEVICWEVSQTIQAPVTIGFAQYITAAENPNRFKKRAKLAGFEFMPTPPDVENSDDDEVNRCITLTDPDSITAMVVVTADVLDYVEMLETKRSQHIRIFIAAITAGESNGHSPLSMHSRGIMAENQYALIDLGKYKKDLLVTEWVDFVRPSAKDSKMHSDAGHLNLYEWIDARCAYLYSQISFYAGKQDLGNIQQASGEISHLVNLAKRVQEQKAEEIISNEKKKILFSGEGEREQKILFILNKREFVSMSMLLQEIPCATKHNLLRDISSLKGKGLIRSTGYSNMIRYSLA